MSLFWRLFDPFDAWVVEKWAALTAAYNGNPLVARLNAMKFVVEAKSWLAENKQSFQRFAYMALPVVVFLANGQEPAHAYLFDTAQQSVAQAFPVSKTISDMAFNGGRAIFGLYLLVSIFKVLHSIRQEEDWQATAQTPAMVFIGVQLASLATTLIFP
ncbi:hypothetical protein [Gloeobacter morelensis]|uniref:hypothetical protein n=1 Tax=Gloeobacter morelensis TaxID=2907343 RepID=UPI001E2836AD|nr:hypothetical protein [Gloeobacter morelensis]UFP97143.1 hypothetical protein ISF26_23770 [Gloeobacter morelensis MG652769]